MSETINISKDYHTQENAHTLFIKLILVKLSWMVFYFIVFICCHPPKKLRKVPLNKYFSLTQCCKAYLSSIRHNPIPVMHFKGAFKINKAQSPK